MAFSAMPQTAEFVLEQTAAPTPDASPTPDATPIPDVSPTASPMPTQPPEPPTKPTASFIDVPITHEWNPLNDNVKFYKLS